MECCCDRFRRGGGGGGTLESQGVVDTLPLQPPVLKQKHDPRAGGQLDSWTL
jgi:hypothetical protein